MLREQREHAQELVRAEDECLALAKKGASHTVYEARQGMFSERLEQTLSFEEVEYIYESCRSRGYILR